MAHRAEAINTQELRGKPKSATGGAALFFGMRCVSAGSGALIIVLMSRSLSVSDFGVFSLGLTLAGIAAVVSDAGLNTLIVRESIATPEYERSLLRWGVGIRAATGVVSAAAFWLVSFFLVDGTVEVLSMALIVGTLPLLCTTVRINALNKRILLARVAALTLLQSLMWFVAVLVLYLLAPSLLWYSAAYFGTTFVYFGAVYFATTATLPEHGASLDRTQAWAILRSAIPLGIASVLTMTYAKINGILVFAFEGSTASAHFSLAYRLLDQMAILPMTIAMVFAPLVNYRLKDRLPSEELIGAWARVSVAFSVLVATNLAVYSGLVVRGIFGDQYSESVGLLQLLCPVYVLVALGWVLTPVAIAFRETRWQLVVAGIGLVTSVSGGLILIPVIGGAGAALASLLTELAVVLALTHRLRRHINFGRPSVVACLGLVASALVQLCMSFLVESWLGLATSLFLGLITLFAFRALKFNDLNIRRPVG